MHVLRALALPSCWILAFLPTTNILFWGCFDLRIIHDPCSVTSHYRPAVLGKRSHASHSPMPHVAEQGVHSLYFHLNTSLWVIVWFLGIVYSNFIPGFLVWNRSWETKINLEYYQETALLAVRNSPLLKKVFVKKENTKERNYNTGP